MSETDPIPAQLAETYVRCWLARDFDTLRACLRYDLAQARGLIATTRLGDSLLDNAELDRYLAAT